MATAPNLTPRTKVVCAADVRPGHIVIESREHPAVVVRVGRPNGKLRFHCRYVWQASHEVAWPMDDLHPDAAVRISKEK